MLEGRTLLLADDSIAIQKVVELTFGDEGMRVVSVSDGQQAVERLEEVRPDVVLADVFMPELNGYQVCERIKGDERLRHIPVILLVGSFEPFNEAEARRVGADDHLTKPFQSIRQMVSKVGSLLSGKKSDAEADTQKLPAEPETAKMMSQPRGNDWELATADTAPLSPQMRGAAVDSNEPTPQPFADLQMDDSMIEETPAGEFGSPAQAKAGGQPRPFEPPAAPELAEAGLKSEHSAPGPQFAAHSAGVSTAERLEAVGDSAPAAGPTNRERMSDDILLDLDEVEMPHSSATAEADDFILDLQDAAATSPTSATAAGLAPEKSVPADTSQMQDTHPLPSAPEPALTEELPPHFEPQANAVAEPDVAPPSGSSPAHAGQIGLEQLSPAAIDAIARRVVEQLSTKVIEQIAWEVVPQLSELIIKRRLEEEGK